MLAKTADLRNSKAWFFFIEVPLLVAAWAVVTDWSLHYDSGGLFAVFGQFMAVLATIIMMMAGASILLISFLFPVILMVARSENRWAVAIMTFLERRFPARFDGSRFKRPT